MQVTIVYNPAFPEDVRQAQKILKVRQTPPINKIELIKAIKQMSQEFYAGDPDDGWIRHSFDLKTSKDMAERIMEIMGIS